MESSLSKNTLKSENLCGPVAQRLQANKAISTLKTQTATRAILNRKKQKFVIASTLPQ